LAKTNQNTTKNKDSNLMVWSKSLDEGGDNGNEAADPHSPSSAKEISLYKE
jgi:hypothetical protein